MLQQLVQKTTLNNDLVLRIALHLREQYGLLLESVAAGYAARHLIWKYVVEGILRDEGFSPEQIMQRLNEERRTWNADAIRLPMCLNRPLEISVMAEKMTLDQPRRQLSPVVIHSNKPTLRKVGKHEREWQD